MLAAEATPATVSDVRTADRSVVLVEDRAQRDRRLISRLLHALVLAGMSVLIPGEATRFLESELDIDELVSSPPAAPR